MPRLTFGDFITKLKDWDVQIPPGIVGEAIVLTRIVKGTRHFATVMKRRNDYLLAAETVEAHLIGLNIPPDEF